MKEYNILLTVAITVMFIMTLTIVGMEQKYCEEIWKLRVENADLKEQIYVLKEREDK